MMEYEQLWFLNSLVTIRVPCDSGADRVSILEHRVPSGDSPPLHRHRTQDEIFHVLEGEFRMKIDDVEQQVRPGSVVLAPKGTPHSYRVDSPNGGRFLTITVGGDFERFVRLLGRTAERPELPTPTGPPTPEAIQALAATAAQFGIELIGPPMT
jgi:quercetin dioxygenase-like cupin family protein